MKYDFILFSRLKISRVLHLVICFLSPPSLSPPFFLSFLLSIHFFCYLQHKLSISLTVFLSVPSFLCPVSSLSLAPMPSTQKKWLISNSDASDVCKHKTQSYLRFSCIASIYSELAGPLFSTVERSKI